METELLHSRGTPTPGEPVLVMYCYPNDSVDDTEVEVEIKKGLTEMGDQLYNQTALDYYEINKAYPRPNINITGSDHQEKRDDFWIKFRDWVKAQGNDSYKGLHLGVANEFSGGVASGGEDGNSAFSSGTIAVGGSDASSAYTERTGAHEAIHNCVNSGLSSVEDLVYHNGNEHELGKMYSDDSASVMADDSATHYGDCQSPYDWNAQNLDLTTCTIDAVSATIQDEF